MMKGALVTMALLAGCPSPEPGKNPPQVWEATNGSETMIRLSPVEPPPF
jgi:hypothetical protein